MKKLILNYGAGADGLFELDFLKGLDPVKDEVIVLVPEQFKADSEKYLIEALGARGLFHVGVFGLAKLVKEFSLRYGLPQSHLSKFGKNLMLSQMLKELKPRLELYRTKLSRGLVDRLLSLLDALRVEGVSAKELENVSSSLMPTQSLLRKKTREMALIMGEYEAGILASHIDDIALIELLIEELLARAPLKNLHLIVEGFNGMSRQEMRLVAALSHHAGGSTFINILKSNEGVLKSYSDKFVDGLKQAFYDLGDWEFQIEEVLGGDDAGNQRAALFANIFSHTRKKFEVEGLKLVECGNREDELNFIALDILKKIREEGAKWSDFALITNSLDAYQKHYYKVLGSYGIPYFIDARARVVDLSFCAFLVSALEAVRTAFSRRAVISLLKYSSFLELPRLKLGPEEYRRAYEEGQMAAFHSYAKLEIYALKYSLDHDMFFHPKYLASFFGPREGEASIAKPYYGLMKRLRTLSKNLEEAEDFGAMLAALKNFIEETELLERIAKLKSLYQSLYDEEAARRLGAQEAAMTELLTQLDMLGSVELGDYHEFIDLVVSALGDYELGLPPPALDTIVLGTAARSRLIGVKYLYLIGSNEGLLPSKTPTNVFFSENEMISLSELSFTALKRSKNFMDKEVFDIFEKVAFTAKEVCFTYARHDEGGEELGPSYWLRSLERQGCLRIAKPSSPSIEELASAGVLDKYMASLMLEVGGPLAPARLGDIRLNPASEERLRTYMDVYTKSGSDLRARLSDELSQKFSEVFRNISVSKLETHASCPFQFFVNYILSPREMPEEKLDRRSFGSMMHGVMENFVKAYMGAEDREGFKKEAMTIFYDFLAREMDENPDYKYNRVERQVMEVGKSYFEFIVTLLLKHFDTAFLSDVGCEVEIIDERSDFELRGKVDRVDVFEIAGEKYFRVIDYKSSEQAYDAAKFSHGVQIQLPLYLNYFVKGGSEWGEGRPLGFAYFDLKEKLEELKPEEGYNEAKVMENYRLNGKFIRDISLISSMEPGILDTRKSVLARSVALKKNENSWNNNSSSGLISAEAFDRLFSSLDAIIAKLTLSLASANIEIRPCKLPKYTPCTLCHYQNICKFDGARYKSKYRTEPLVPVPDLKS